MGETPIHFPFAGLVVSCPVSRQPARNVGPGKSDYARTTIIGHNVRGVQADNRARGGSRCGLSRFIHAQVAGEAFVVQHIAMLVTVEEAAVT